MTKFRERTRFQTLVGHSLIKNDLKILIIPRSQCVFNDFGFLNITPKVMSGSLYIYIYIFAGVGNGKEKKQLHLKDPNHIMDTKISRIFIYARI